MLERTERISLRIYSVLSQVEPEPGARRAPAPQHCPTHCFSARYRVHIVVAHSPPPLRWVRTLPRTLCTHRLQARKQSI